MRQRHRNNVWITPASRGRSNVEPQLMRRPGTPPLVRGSRPRYRHCPGVRPERNEASGAVDLSRHTQAARRLATRSNAPVPIVRRSMSVLTATVPASAIMGAG